LNNPANRIKPSFYEVKKKINNMTGKNLAKNLNKDAVMLTQRTRQSRRNTVLEL